MPQGIVKCGLQNVWEIGEMVSNDVIYLVHYFIGVMWRWSNGLLAFFEAAGIFQAAITFEKNIWI